MSLEMPAAIFIARDEHEKMNYTFASEMCYILFELRFNFRRRYKHLSEEEYNKLTPDDVVDHMMELFEDLPDNVLS